MNKHYQQGIKEKRSEAVIKHWRVRSGIHIVLEKQFSNIGLKTLQALLAEVCIPGEPEKKSIISYGTKDKISSKPGWYVNR